MKELESHVTDKWHMYSCADPEAMETEVQKLIYSFVVALKPDFVLEIGTHTGYTARWICEGLKENNNHGVLHTWENNTENALEAGKRLHEYGDLVEIIIGDALDVTNLDVDPAEYDIAVIDGGPDRLAEYSTWLPRVKPGGIVFIHDSLKEEPNASRIASIPETKLVLRTPRGLTIAQKA